MLVSRMFDYRSRHTDHRPGLELELGLEVDRKLWKLEFRAFWKSESASTDFFFFFLKRVVTRSAFANNIARKHRLGGLDTMVPSKIRI